MSGPAAFDMTRSIAGKLPPPRRASLRALRDAGGSLLDRALVLRFEAGTSATGEDLVEFHCHGGVAVVRAVEQALLADPRARAAQPGEFTRQALENGRIDLVQAKGLADLLEAETETQRRYALAASEGHVSRLIHGWIDRLVAIAAQIEASIDYGDEGEVIAGVATLEAIIAERDAVAHEIAEVLAAPPVERWRDGIKVVLAGPPNSGKSTLFNLLVGREAAIVAPTAGTTRDRIEAAVRRSGVAYVLTDTAGIRDATDDPVERLGIERAATASAGADLVLWLGDERPPMKQAIHVRARADVPGRVPLPSADLSVSAIDRASIDRLWVLLAERTAEVHSRELLFHHDERNACRDALSTISEQSDDTIILADALRTAIGSLGGVLGMDAPTAILDRVFSRFCLGK